MITGILVGVVGTLVVEALVMLVAAYWIGSQPMGEPDF